MIEINETRKLQKDLPNMNNLRSEIHMTDFGISHI